MANPRQQSLSMDVWNVSDLTEGIKNVLEDNFSALWVEGEISNFSRPASGHCYFTLKDDSAQLRCVLWRWMAEELFFTPQDGMQVRAHGDVSVYPPRGQYQLQVRTMRPVGEGELQKAFEALKKKLKEEGLFDEKHKQPLPRFPHRIGIVTSGTGAAVQDMLSTLERRFPMVQVQILPVKVQGSSAASEIVRAIETFNRRSDDQVDLLIVGRGGGSVEDLWAFNEEPVARAIFHSDIPVVSAVGHETDFSIADFVADRRAATPTMAGELAVPDRRDLVAAVSSDYERLREKTRQYVRERKRQIQFMTQSHRFKWPVDHLHHMMQQCDDLTRRLDRCIDRFLERKQSEVETLQHRIQGLDPHQPLQRGYTWIEKNGTPITSIRQLHVGDAVTLQFKDGQRSARIENPSNGETRPE